MEFIKDILSKIEFKKYSDEKSMWIKIKILYLFYFSHWNIIFILIKEVYYQFVFILISCTKLICNFDLISHERPKSNPVFAYVSFHCTSIIIQNKF